MRRDTSWESWTEISDVGERFNGIVLSSEEYLRVETLYIDAVARFAHDAGADGGFSVVFRGHQSPDFALSLGQEILRSDLAPIVRGNLRGDLDCALEDLSGTFQLEFGYDLYMRIAAARPCRQAVTDTVRAGLYVESGVPLVGWENSASGQPDGSTT